MTTGVRNRLIPCAEHVLNVYYVRTVCTNFNRIRLQCLQKANKQYNPSTLCLFLLEKYSFKILKYNRSSFYL